MTIALLIMAILIGYLRRGRLKNLASLEIKLIPLIIFAFIIQMGIFFGYKYNVELIRNYDILLHFVSYIILFAGLMGNFNNKWFILITFGVVCNFVVIFLNGGKMPVSLDAASIIGINVDNMKALLSTRAGTHQQLQAGGLVWFLSDVLPVKFPEPFGFFSNIYSAGDFVMYVGIIGLIQSAMIQHNVEDEFEERIPENLTQIRDFDSLKSENHMDEVYLHDHDAIAIKEIPEIKIENIEEVNSSAVFIDQRAEETIVINIDDISLGHNEVVADEVISGETEEQDLKEVFEEIDKNIEMKVTKEDFLLNEDKFEQTIVLKENEIASMDAEESLQQTEKAKDLYSENLNAYNELVDTTHQFIIVDGKIKENPNFNKNPANFVFPLNESSKIEINSIKPENHVEELEMTQVELDTIKANSDDAINRETTDTADLHLLQKITDNERVDLMKKMRQRKENGYTLVEVVVANKKINFWKKDL